MPVYRVKDGRHQDAEEFLRLFLNALDEELVAIQTYISTHKPVSAPSVEGLEEEAQAGGVVKRDYTVCQLFSLLHPELNITDVCMEKNRPVWLSRPSRAYLAEGPVRPYARQASPTSSPSKTGGHFSSTSRSVFPPFSLFRRD